MASPVSECDPVDRFLLGTDDICMPMPDLESEPHLLISKVRKQYMEYMIKLLSINYETHQKLVNKNIYLPSAIWRCAKNLELSAAKHSMVVQLYRNNILSVVKELKNDTKKGKLFKNLYSCLHHAPENDKKTQTSNDNYCKCSFKRRKKIHRTSTSPQNVHEKQSESFNGSFNNYHGQVTAKSKFTIYHPPESESHVNGLNMIPPVLVEPDNNSINSITNNSFIENRQMSVESQASDELMLQLEKLFQGDATDDDLFEGALCDNVEIVKDIQNKNNIDINNSNMVTKQDMIIKNHAAQIKSLDERLASLTGLLNTDHTIEQKTDDNKNRRRGSSKWLCEEYFLKQKLHELLDQIGDRNRKGLEKLKEKFVDLFGYDSDDEGILSPLNETPEFITSCKERIAPWVVKILTPYYIKGHIVGKSIFKALAKHLIRLIYQCSRYPEEYEVNSFVTDFLKNHNSIRCEADFKEFRIENI